MGKLQFSGVAICGLPSVLTFKIADDFSLVQLTLAMFFIAICGHDYINRVFDPFVMAEFFKFFRKNYLTLGRQ